ncbi:radical SAM family heme chaperone HemW [Parvularcula marina]|uniref:Heme chaperone HemW n=1 Tax=Parvularcula marina TaxID=2292771 RepID=A0A371RIE6_9PROT|nr:radical SAM family heme chaperone HemW [Parvularcula marina]RFB05210.1 radical SAM family heme chaperone HemW [Parvularcula marina]
MSLETGLYIHWPFCSRICPYCDFTITRSRDEDFARWVAEYVLDLEKFRERMGSRQLASIYFGGGTPSLLPASAVGQLIEAADRLFGLAPAAEITLEANPTDAEISHFAGFRSAGINRLSLGVQSFDDAQLSFLGRNHGEAEARRAVDVAASTFEAYTLDFIYALPDEDLVAWEMRLSDILAVGAPHLSLYQLTVEPETAFAKAVGRGDWHPMPDERAAGLYAMTQSMTASAGCPGYEISNHARPGAEAKHNSLYWRGADWIGIGPGSHGRLTLEVGRSAIAGRPTIREWLGMPHQERYDEEQLDEEAQLIELLAGGLRQVAGLDLNLLKEEQKASVLSVTGALLDDGMVQQESHRLMIPEDHRLITDYIISRLVGAL